MRFLSVLWMMLCVAPPAMAAREQVMAVKDAQTLVLSTTGEARFAELVMPDAARAQQWMTTHLLQQEMDFETVAIDRYGRALVAGNAAAAMLRDGVAVYFSQRSADIFYVAAEAEARAAKRGIWGESGVTRTPENAAEAMGKFVVVEGMVTGVYQGKSATYLNFGDDWREDFSVMIKGRARRAFEEAFVNLGEGARVRVRGTLYQENGPMLRLTSPSQMEWLAE